MDPTIYSEILKDDVAAGLGAFKTDIKLPLTLISKSCSNPPLIFINCALIPAEPEKIIFDLISGMIFFKLLTNKVFDKDRKNSPAVIRGYLRINLWSPW